MTKEERRRLEAQKRQQKIKAAKGAVIALSVGVAGLIAFMVTQG